MKLIPKDVVLAEIEKFMYGANLEADIASTGECFDEKVADDFQTKFDEQGKMMLRASFVRKVLATQNNPIIVKQMLSEVFKVAPNVMDYVCNDAYLNNSAKECITQ